MKLSGWFCGIGNLLLVALAVLHGSGFETFTAEFEASNASPMLKLMFPVLYGIPSLFLLTMAAFGGLALAAPDFRRPLCLVLAPSVFLCGALGLLVNQWVPLVVMGIGSACFLGAALTVRRPSRP